MIARVVVAIVALVTLSAGSCEDIGPAQKPVRRSPTPQVTPLKAGQPAVPGRACTPKGATAHTQTGVQVTCLVYGGADHPRWKG